LAPGAAPIVLAILIGAEIVGQVMLSEAKQLAQFAARFLAALGMTMVNVFSFG